MQRDGQAVGLKLGRKETAREVPREIDSFLDVMHDFVGVLDFSRSPVGEFFAKDLRRQRSSGQMLAETVV